MGCGLDVREWMMVIVEVCLDLVGDECEIGN